MRRQPPERTSRAGQNPIDQLLHRGDEAVRIERVALEPEGGVTGEHQIVVDRPAMGDVLESFLDAEAARVSEAPCRILLIVRPGRESALAEAAHALGL